MPSNSLYIDTNFPTFTGEESIQGLVTLATQQSITDLTAAPDVKSVAVTTPQAKAPEFFSGAFFGTET